MQPTLTDPDAEPAESSPTLTDDQRRDVIGWFASGKPLAAIRVYREVVDCDLETAKQAVLTLADGQPVPEGWAPPEMEHPPLSPEEQVVFPADEGWTPGEGNVVNLPKPKRTRPELSVAPAPVGPPPDKVIKEADERRRFPLSDEEVSARQDQLTMLTLDAEAMKLRHKSMRAEITEERKAHEARISAVVHEINDRAETRDVTVVYTACYADGVVRETVKGTGVPLGSKPLSGPDAQVPLFTGKAPAADVVVTEDDGAHD